MKTQLPQSVVIVRHGQSSGNVARDLAEAKGLREIDIALRDVDVPLSTLGEQQARALGRWLGRADAASRPTIVLSSPYVRARQTAEHVLAELPERDKIPFIFDERLREREFGIIDRLTRAGIEHKFPEQAEFYSRLKKFYYRPPGGESWCDVILRVRSLMESLARDYAGERVYIFCHTVVVYCFRYLFERMDEATILDIDRANSLGNCSITAYEQGLDQHGRDAMILQAFNWVTPLEAEGAPTSWRPDVPGGPK